MFRKFAILLVLLVSSFCFSQDLLGAQKALEKITEKAGAPGTDAKLPQDIKAFGKVYRKLDATEAAHRWADLAVRASEDKGSPYGDMIFPQVVSLLLAKSLPEPKDVSSLYKLKNSKTPR